MFSMGWINEWTLPSFSFVASIMSGLVYKNLFKSVYLHIGVLGNLKDRNYRRPHLRSLPNSCWSLFLRKPLCSYGIGSPQPRGFGCVPVFLATMNCIQVYQFPNVGRGIFIICVCREFGIVIQWWLLFLRILIKWGFWNRELLSTSLLHIGLQIKADVQRGSKMTGRKSTAILIFRVILLCQKHLFLFY